MPWNPRRKVVGPAALLVAASLVVCIGCVPMGTMRIKTMDIAVPDSHETSTGATVKIVEITDARTNVMRGIGPVRVDGLHAHVDEADIAERAFGELLAGGGGFVVLPEGRIVADVVELTLARGLRRAGYEVVEEDDPSASEAVALTVTIREFWAWKEETWPEGETGTYFSARISVCGPAEPFTDCRTIAADVKHSPKGYATLWLLRLDSFQGALKKGIRELVEETARVAAPAESFPG